MISDEEMEEISKRVQSNPDTKEYDTIHELVEGTPLTILSERALEVLWKEFSALHFAVWLIQTKDEARRFIEWVQSGDDAAATG